nr:SDR family NAD(P)-dependent oxidoreductase [Mycobacterium sp. 3519A]
MITGASRGIGAATALVFAERGFRVVVIIRRLELGAARRQAGRRIALMAEKPGVAADYIATLIPRLTQNKAQRHCERYVHPYLTADGRVDLGKAPN